MDDSGWLHHLEWLMEWDFEPDEYQQMLSLGHEFGRAAVAKSFEEFYSRNHDCIVEDFVKHFRRTHHETLQGQILLF